MPSAFDSPVGCASRSSTTARVPASRSSQASINPVGPPPTTITSSIISASHSSLGCRSAPLCSMNLPQCHNTRLPPPPPTVAPPVTRGQRPPIIAEHAGTARVVPKPGPDTIPAGQGLPLHVPVAVEKVRLKLAGGGVVSNDLEAPDV